MRKRSLTVAALAALTLVATRAPAQDAYGRGTVGTGNATPLLTCNQAYMGNAQFALTVSNGRGGSSGWLGLSTTPGSFFVGGTEILIGIPNLVALFPVSLNGAAGVPGAGSATLNLPLTFPVAPALAGLSYYAQYVGNDYPTPSTPAASRGLRVEITMPPSVFVGLSVGGSTDTHYFVDPLAPALQRQANATHTDNVTDAVWTRGGRDLFVGTSIRNEVNWADVGTFPPVWQTVYTASASGCYGMGFDRATKRLFTFTDPGTNSRELVALDGDPNSSTFGQVLANSTSLFATNLVERWALSPSGKLAVFMAPLIAPFNLEIIDTDPASATYMQIIRTAPVPISGGLSLGVRVRFTNEEDAILVLIQQAGSTPAEIARYDIAGNTFVDFNPGMSGVQHIGANSSPPAALGSAPGDIELSPDGTFAIVSGFGGSGWAGRLDLQPFNSSVFAYTPITTTASNAWACGLSRDGKLMSVGSWSPPQLFFFDPLTGASKGTVALSGASNIYTITHR